MPTVRTKSISTKVTEEEYAHFEILAGEQKIREWARETLLKAVQNRTPPSQYSPAFQIDEIAVTRSLSEGYACSPIRLRLESELTTGLPRME